MKKSLLKIKVFVSGEKVPTKTKIAVSKILKGKKLLIIPQKLPDFTKKRKIQIIKFKNNA